jgi:hypothetical protein
MASQMVIFPASMVLEAGQTFTVRTFTWTSSVNGTAKIVEAVRDSPAPIKSTPALADPNLGSSVPAAHRLLPCHQGRQLDNSDLVKSIDWVTEGLAKTLTLVEAIRDQPTEDGYNPIHHYWAERPAWASRQRRQDSYLVITAIPGERMIHYRPVPSTGLRLGDCEAPTSQPPNTSLFGLANTASTCADHAMHLFTGLAEHDHVLDLYLLDLPEVGQPVPIVNMVRIEEVGGN